MNILIIKAELGFTTRIIERITGVFEINGIRVARNYDEA
jgi:hypothetical protein